MVVSPSALTGVGYIFGNATVATETFLAGAVAVDGAADPDEATLSPGIFPSKTIKASLTYPCIASCLDMDPRAAQASYFALPTGSNIPGRDPLQGPTSACLKYAYIFNFVALETSRCSPEVSDMAAKACLYCDCRSENLRTCLTANLEALELNILLRICARCELWSSAAVTAVNNPFHNKSMPTSKLSSSVFKIIALVSKRTA